MQRSGEPGGYDLPSDAFRGRGLIASGRAKRDDGEDTSKVKVNLTIRKNACLRLDHS